MAVELANKLERLGIGDSLVADNGAQIDYVDIGDGFSPCFVFVFSGGSDIRVDFITGGAKRADAQSVEEYVRAFDWTGVSHKKPTRWAIVASASEHNPCWHGVQRVGWRWREPTRKDGSVVYMLSKYAYPTPDNNALLMTVHNSAAVIAPGRVFAVTQKKRLCAFLQVVSFAYVQLDQLKPEDCRRAGYKDADALAAGLHGQAKYSKKTIPLWKIEVRRVGSNILFQNQIAALKAARTAPFFQERLF
jgi:hypothetical protein